MMTLQEAMEQRHSVRQYEEKPIDSEAVSRLEEEIAAVNREGGMHIQLFTDEPEAFQANAPHYGQFNGCRNYFALVGPKGKDEEIGYYGERLVLLAQQLGLNTCWVAMTYKKGKVNVDAAKGEKLYVVISLGYGKTPGGSHKVKSAEDVSDCSDDSPAWYKNGLKAALLAPTAMNQQKFTFERDGNRVKVKAGLGFYAKMDLGIVKYHFELGAGQDNFVWA